MRRLALLLLLCLCACHESSIAVDDSGLAPDADEVLDASFEWEPPVPFDGATPPDDPGPGVMLFRVDSLDLGTDADTGFDLDGFDTRSLSDPVGCGIIDGEGGVDNRLQNLVSIGETFGFSIDSLLLGDTIELFLEIRGYEGLDYDWVRADIISDGVIIAENAPGLVQDGIVEIWFDELGLPASPAIGGTFTLPLRLVRLRFDIDAPEATQALLGGAIVWDDGTDTDLQSLVQTFIDAVGDSFPVGVVQTIIVSNLDIALGGPGTPCDAISLASFVDVELVEVELVEP
jgi:hypothetical protein